jgi:hypothetical protein
VYLPTYLRFVGTEYSVIIDVDLRYGVLRIDRALLTPSMSGCGQAEGRKDAGATKVGQVAPHRLNRSAMPINVIGWKEMSLSALS